MTRDPRFDILFESVRLGPVTTPNRFYQVPHCTGMGYSMPATLNAMREIKAEGGWGVVNTEYCSIHPSSDDMPHPFASLWDEGDVRNLSGMTEAVHRHGALAGVELWYGGIRTSNLASRSAALAPTSMPTSYAPWQSQRMDRADIQQFREWHLAAARRARQADFDIVYAYAAHSYMLAQFLDPVINNRTDEYGGELANRSRLLREVVEDMRAAIGDRCAIAIRIETLNDDGHGRDERAHLLETLAPLIDLFDVTVPDYSQEMGVSRFVKEASLEADIAHIRAVTGKPVVSVGRFTSPETMLSQVRRGVLDLVGAARPSIADPFLPEKIRGGRFDDIRECIGCNICYAQDSLGVAIRCTQNPTMGEEWRRGWHPEHVPAVAVPEPVLIIGAGPAGLEAAMVLGKAGVPVMLAEADRDLGGRVTLESRLPGLSEWARVRDWRVGQLEKLPHVEIFRESRMGVADILDTGIGHVMIATGASWRTDGRGHSFARPVDSFNDPRTISPDHLMRGERPARGPVVLFDDDHYYMGSVLAERLVTEGFSVTLVTPRGVVGSWGENTVEQARSQTRLLELGVEIIVNTTVCALGDGTAVLQCVYSGRQRELPCAAFVPVTSREPQDALYHDLNGKGLKTLVRMGDCKAPGIIAQAVLDGHQHARAFGRLPDELIVRRDRVII